MKQFVTFLLILTTTSFFYGQDISIGVRDTVASKILNQDRELAIYLPPSYYSSGQQSFPVLYILDGDYNFQYVAGLLELEGGISERTPEMILVAISGKGSATYRTNCKPNIEGSEDKGNADQVARFMEEELIPYIDTNYKTADFKILSGHSLGGLFVINTVLNHPKLFDRYIAISPALWWSDNAINQIAKEKISNDNFKTNVYTSLANEQGMGLDSFLGVATSSLLKNTLVIYGIVIICILIALFWGFRRRKIALPLVLVLAGLVFSAYLLYFYYPQDENFKFKKFADENHNSVGEPTYRWALEDMFKTWHVEDNYFASAKALKSHYNKVKTTYGTSFNISNTVLGNTYYVLKDNISELDSISATLKTHDLFAYEKFNSYRASKLMEGNPKASEQLAKTILKSNPKSSESYRILAEINLARNNTVLADSLINKALDLAQDQKQRQWQINEIIEIKNQINKK